MWLEDVIGRWADGQIRKHDVRFSPDLLLYKKWEEVINRVASLMDIWEEKKLTMKGLRNAYIPSVIIYRLTAVT